MLQSSPLRPYPLLAVRSAGGPVLTEGDIVVDEEAERNADPCTSSGCMWRPWTDGMVYIPYYINNQYCESKTWSTVSLRRVLHQQPLL